MHRFPRSPLPAKLLVAGWFFGGMVGSGGLLGGAGCAPSDGPRLGETSSELVTVTAGAGGNFGDIPVGAMAGPITIRVAPSSAGSSYDLITQITEACPNFSVVPGGLPREVYKQCNGTGVPRVVDPTGTPSLASPASLTSPASRRAAPVTTALPCSEGYEVVDYAFPAYFAPTVAGAQSCVVTVTLDSGPKTVMLTGNGLPPPREIDLSRASIAFGDVRRNAASSPQAVVVSNTGSAALTITSAAVNGAAFSLSGAASTTIAGNTSYTYTLSCAPGDALGPLSGTFTLSSDDPDEGTLSLPLSCTGVDSNLTVQPSPIAVAARVEEPREVTVDLVNSGGAPMTVTSVTVAGNDLELLAAPTGVIPAGGSMQARLRYMARAEAEISGMLTVSFDGQTRGVPVSARAKTAAMSISPDGDVDLGAVCVGTSKEQAFSALGAGGAGFVISNVAVSGEGFALATAAGPINVAGAGANTVAIRAVAAPLTAGPMTGSVQVATDIPNAAPRSINLTALAIAQGVGAAPAEHDFGSILVNEPSNVQSISIANCSGGVLAISGVTLEGADAADFRIITEPAKSIPPSGTSSLLLEMRPRTPGTKAASLVISHGEGSTAVPLGGDGYLPLIEAERIGTYYSCSARGGDGSGAWLLGLGLGAMMLLRRRR